VAGPVTTAPVCALNRLPWQGQRISPPSTLPTVQPSWVHTAEKPWTESPERVTTTLAPARTTPPSVGTLLKAVSSRPFAGAGPYALAAVLAPAPPAGRRPRTLTKPTTAAAAEIAKPVNAERRVSGWVIAS